MSCPLTCRTWLAVGSLLAGTGVALGALGAHGLQSRLDAAQMQSYDVAVRYQLYHALALVAIGLAGTLFPNRRAQAAAWAFLVGMVLFSGGIYAWLATGCRPLVHVVPVGGVSWIVGWLLLACSACGSRAGRGDSPSA